MIIMKFGGSSLKNAEWYNKALTIISAKIKKHKAIVVLSASHNTTDLLQTAAHAAAEGKLEIVNQCFSTISTHHISILHALAKDNNTAQQEAKTRIQSLLQELQSILTGVRLVREISVKMFDVVLSFGELLSSELLFFAATIQGIHSQLEDSRSYIQTDSSHGKALVNHEITYEKIRKTFSHTPCALYIVQGFIASNEEKITTTLGRGGSDYTASLFGAALEAEYIEIWTDVTGIMTADPRVVPNAKLIHHMSYDQAAELSYFGAQVLHPATMYPAIVKEIPIHIKHTGFPNEQGTVITKKPLKSKLPIAIASRSHFSIINIQSPKMFNAFGYLRQLFEIFESYRISVDTVTTSEISVSISVHSSALSHEVIQSLQTIGKVSVKTSRSVLCIIGKSLQHHIGHLKTVLEPLDASFSIDMISLGQSENNLTIILSQSHVEHAIRTIHKHLFEDNKNDDLPTQKSQENSA